MYEINLKDSNLYLSQFNAGAEVAVVSVVRIGDYLLQNDFRVNHHDAETVFAGRDNRDAGSDPAKVVEDFRATDVLLAVHPAVERQLRLLRTRLEEFIGCRRRGSVRPIPCAGRPSGA